MPLLDSIREQNPWWLSPEAIANDTHLVALRGSQFRRVPPELNQIDLAGPYVYTLRGPRQVGKTTLVKMIIEKLLKEGTNPKAIAYFTLDLVTNPEGIVEVFRGVKDLTPDLTGSRFFFLDEISSVPDWQKAIKYARDTGLAASDFLLLTGSSAADIRRGAERMPGRRGEKHGLDKLLLPLSFAEFAQARRVSPYSECRRLHLPDFLSEEAATVLKSAMLMNPDLTRALGEYVTVGGFPRSVNELLGGAGVTKATMEMLWSLISGDVEKWHRDRRVALKIMERLSTSLGTSLSWRRIAQAAGVSDPSTAQSYVELLSEEFVLLVLYFLDMSRQSISPRKAKKVYFVDPLMHHLVCHLLHPDRDLSQLVTRRLPALAEDVVALELFRAMERDMVETFKMPTSLFYWRSSHQREVDFLVRVDGDIIPIEVKYQADVRRRDAMTITQSFGKGMVLSKSTLDLTGRVKILPLPLFLWLLKPQPQE